MLCFAHKTAATFCFSAPCFLFRQFVCCASPVSGAQDRTSACIEHVRGSMMLYGPSLCAVVTGDALDTATHAACEAGLLGPPSAEAGDGRGMPGGRSLSDFKNLWNSLVSLSPLVSNCLLFPGC